MHWRYDDLLSLPVEVYEVLVEEINEELKRQAPDGAAPADDDWPQES